MSIPSRLLLDTLQVAQLVLKCYERRDFPSARIHMDRLRQLRSFMADFVLFENPENWDASDPNTPLLLEAAKAATRSFKAIELIRATISYDHEASTYEELNIVLDSLLPEIWDWEQDLLVSWDPPSEALTQALIDRGQKRFLFFSSQDCDISSVSSDWVCLQDAKQLSEKTSNWVLNLPRRIIAFPSTSTDLNTDELWETITGSISRDTVMARTAKNFSKSWVKQQYLNSRQAALSLRFIDLKLELKNRDVIIVSPGPSLAKNITVLAKEREKFTVLAVAQSCPALLLHNIIPDYVMVMDAQDYSEVLDDFPCDKSALIILEQCSPAFFNKKFSHQFVLTNSDSQSGLAQANGDDYFIGRGGSVSTAAFGLCIDCSVNSVTLIGQDLSIEEGFYCHRPGRDSSPIYDNDGEVLITGSVREKLYRIPGYYGGQVRTKTDFWVYHFQFEREAKKCPNNIALYNATEGGAFIEGFVHKPLEEAALNITVPDVNSNDRPVLSINERNARLESLVSHFKSQLNSLKEILILCNQAQELIKNYVQRQNASELLGQIEAQISDETREFSVLSGTLQAELEYFSSKVRQSKNLEQNLSISFDLYSLIETASNDLSNQISESLDRVQDAIVL